MNAKPTKPRRPSRARRGDPAADLIDTELRIQAEELAANRENTSVPGRAAVKKALRDLLDERRRRDARAEALAATGWSDDRGSDDESDVGGRDVLEDWSFPEE